MTICNGRGKVICMTLAARLRNFAARLHVKKKAAQAAAAAGDVEAVAAVEAAEREADEALEEELDAELQERICERFGEAWLMDTHTRQTIELELRTEGYGADRSDDGRQVYSLPHGELQRRVADGEVALPGEDQMAWDQRVLRDRLARGAPLGQHLEQLQRLLAEMKSLQQLCAEMEDQLQNSGANMRAELQKMGVRLRDALAKAVERANPMGPCPNASEVNPCRDRISRGGRTDQAAPASPIPK